MSEITQLNSTAASKPQADEQRALRAVLESACRLVAPVWPLGNFVAVNPYLGFTDRSLEEVADHMAKTAGARSAMPGSYYLQAIDDGRLEHADIEKVLTARGQHGRRAVDQLLERVRGRAQSAPASAAVPTVADVGHGLTGQDWNWLVVDRVSSWAGNFFDDGQVMWTSVNHDAGVYGSWREEALLDRTPEVMGLAGFRRAIGRLPAERLAAAAYALDRLGIPEDGQALYLHRLLMRVGGWAAYAARIVWDEQLYARSNDTLLEFLAVQLGWEVAMRDALAERGIERPWQEAMSGLARLASESTLDDAMRDELLLQEAFDLAEQRRLVTAFDEAASEAPQAGRESRPPVQAVFCIDVRSEVFRRQLEASAPGVETIGFAGFFAFAVDYVALGHEHHDTQCPVLLTPTHQVHETLPRAEDTQRVLSRRRLAHHVRRAWTSFKMGAVSCFSFVGPVGLMYLPKLFTDSFGWTRPVPHPARDAMQDAALAARQPSLDACGHHHGHGGIAVGIPLDERIELAEGALRAMSLTEGFAPLVMITGHGSTTVNNPHWTGLDCGACGGHTGEANSRVAAAVFNDPAVRQGLAQRGIEIPDDTFFLACQHDTTTDEVVVFNRDQVPAEHAGRLAQLDRWLASAGRLARAERARRLPMSSSAPVDKSVIARSRDWAQLRPEWGLAGCSAFIVAPRQRSARLDLGGRAFLHSYDWRQDDGYGVLELVMTAPMVVASWISLQYYASTVDNRVFGAGNKTLHNVVGRVGVYEGNAGDLRVGLPWQTVHDGERYQHDPLRLKVVIEAPIEAINGIIEKHDAVRQLCDNGWVQLLAMDDNGRISHRYTRDLYWEPIEKDAARVAAAA
jgi:uncharacterized protein YbcC (UPF0753/DUF2309 family)